jgi:surfactin synthase thioesterase subunit
VQTGAGFFNFIERSEFSMRIIFFHHAGGDRYAFKPYWPLLKEKGWEGATYEFPGHGDRFNEDLLHDAHQLADDAFKILRSDLQGKYILFGNSMGSLVAYLLLHRIEEAGVTRPLHFLAPSRKSPASNPSVLRNEPLSGEAFWQMIREYGGPDALMENAELKELYEPILRADYNILETYQHEFRPKLKVSATILYGADDRYSLEKLQGWTNHFQDAPAFRGMKGGHFFVYEQPHSVLDIVARRMPGPG